ncbi:MAG: hypothetical protein WD794_13740 [Mycobacteriales bacterium]
MTVGEEVLLLGGDSSPLCPPGANCVDAPEPQRDGAAYRPSTDTWRALPRDPLAPAFDRAVVGKGNGLVLESLPPSPGVPPDGLRVQASSADLITAGEGLVLEVPRRRWHVLEPAPGAPSDGVVGTWVSRQLVVFGGGSTASRPRSLTAETYLLDLAVLTPHRGVGPPEQQRVPAHDFSCSS